jgi:hypothetical protein
MIRLLGMLVLLLGVAAAIGYYRGWFSTEVVKTNGHDSLTVTVDKDNVNWDKASAQEQVKDLEHK